MSKNQAKLLVLGVDGNVSQGILKALAATHLNYRVIGGALTSLAVGAFFCDHALITPLAVDPLFPTWLIDICHRYQIDGILSGVEPVLNVLSQMKESLVKVTGAVALVSPYEKISICQDKLQTAEWLKNNGLNYPETVEVQDTAGVERLVEKHGYQLVAKPRVGKGSQGIVYIKSQEDLEGALAKEHYILQKYLGRPDQEYTASTFTDSDGQLRGVIIFRRKLSSGTTVIAEVVDSPLIRSEVIRIVEALRPLGPCNMQLRLDGDQPVCFEINLRYSGTAPIRAHFGFNDVEEGVRHFILGEPAFDLPHVTRGVALRYWNEVYLDDHAPDLLAEDGELLAPYNQVKVVEDFGLSFDTASGHYERDPHPPHQSETLPASHHPENKTRPFLVDQTGPTPL